MPPSPLARLTRIAGALPDVLTAVACVVVSKAAWIFLDPRNRALEQDRQRKAWAFSVAAYLGAVFAGLVLPLPRLGLGEAVVPQLGLPGGGEWIERPHTAVAAMAIYYVAMATFKWCMDRPRATPAG